MISKYSVTNNLPIIIGFFCLINGLMFHIGSFNLRIGDVFFFITIALVLMFYKNNTINYSRSCSSGINMILILLIWITISGFVNFSSYSDLYQKFFFKRYLNKDLWLLAYAFFYLMLGREEFLRKVLIGISICSLLNAILVLLEYIKILNGEILDYSFLERFGIFIDIKKEMIINQDLIRPTGLMLDPNYTAAYTGIGALYFDYLRKNINKLYIILSILCVVPSLLLVSRTGLYSIIICFLLSLIFRIKHFRNREVYIVFPQLMFFVVFFFVFVVIYFYSFDEQFVSNQIERLMMNDSSALTRTWYIEYFCNNATLSQIIFGCGSGSSGMVLGNYFFGSDLVWSPESNYITFLIEYGVLFIAVYFLIVLLIFKKLIDNNFCYAMIFLYLNIIGISYNFLSDRVFYFLTCCFIMYSFDNKLKQSKQ